MLQKTNEIFAEFCLGFYWAQLDKYFVYINWRIRYLTSSKILLQKVLFIPGQDIGRADLAVHY